MSWLSSLFKTPKAPDYKPVAEANKYAADLEKQAADDSIAEWRKQFDLTREDFRPWRDAGKRAITSLDKGVTEGLFDLDDWEGFGTKDFEASPGYAFRKQEGESSFMRTLAAGSGGRTGAAGKALTRYGQNVASAEFAASRERAERDYSLKQQKKQTSFTNLLNVSNVGQAATTTTNQLGQAATSNITQNLQHGAAALGAGEIGAQNAMVEGQHAANASKQQGFDNMLAVLGLGVKAASGFTGG